MKRLTAGLVFLALAAATASMPAVAQTKHDLSVTAVAALRDRRPVDETPFGEYVNIQCNYRVVEGDILTRPLRTWRGEIKVDGRAVSEFRGLPRDGRYSYQFNWRADAVGERRISCELDQRREILDGDLDNNIGQVTLRVIEAEAGQAPGGRATASRVVCPASLDATVTAVAPAARRARTATVALSLADSTARGDGVSCSYASANRDVEDVTIDLACPAARPAGDHAYDCGG